MARSDEHFKWNASSKLSVNSPIIVHIYFIGLLGELSFRFSYEHLMEGVQCSKKYIKIINKKALLFCNLFPAVNSLADLSDFWLISQVTRLANTFLL